MKECAFCKLSKDKNIKKIYENDNFFSIYDINPVVEKHSLIIPKKHFKTILDIPNSLAPELLDCIKNTFFIIAREDKEEKGFNIISNNFKIAGQVINHAHFHILPRKKGDGIKIVC